MVRCADFPSPQDHLSVCRKDGKTCEIYRNDGTRLTESLVATASAPRLRTLIRT